jgi:single-stranded-DNA-specific exonuclease
LDTIPDDTKLVIAPDSSSNQFDEHQQLKNKNIDVLVIDHHEAEKVSEAACIINNQLCDYPSKSLSGAGMVYKFCSYIDSILEVDYAENYLDLAALGMVADMMDLRDYETKRLIDKGLSNVNNPFMLEMMNVQNYSIEKHGGFDPFCISFYIAPQVNATIRMGSQEEKLLLFKSMLENYAYEKVPSTKRGCKGQMETLVEQACRNCTNIKNRQTKARDEGFAIVESLIEEENLLDNKILYIQIPEEKAVNKNLTGLIANQLMAEYQRPVALLNKVNKDGATFWEGSCRNYDKSAFTNFKDFLNNSNLVNFAEGHQSAFGLGVVADQMENLIEYTNTALADFSFSPHYDVDFIFSGSNFSPADILEVAELKYYWGQGLSEPYIAIERINVTKDNIQLLSPDKHPTLKITLANGVSLMKFKSSQEEFNSLYRDTGSTVITIIGTCNENNWNGNISA